MPCTRTSSDSEKYKMTLMELLAPLGALVNGELVLQILFESGVLGQLEFNHARILSPPGYLEIDRTAAVIHLRVYIPLRAPPGQAVHDVQVGFPLYRLTASGTGSGQ